jgi:peptidase M1-like protein
MTGARIEAHSRTRRVATQVTKVVARTRRRQRLLVGLLAALIPAFGQETAPPLAVSHSPAENLFLQLSDVGLDSSRVYRARDLTIDRAAFHISFTDGVIGFTQDVAGCATGAFFEGEGEILLTPPDQVERASMILHTGAAILEERFNSAYFRFNDDTFAEMQPYLVPATEDATEFVSRRNQTTRNLDEPDALRLFMTFSQHPSATSAGQKVPLPCGDPNDRFLHARMQGQTKGTFDVFYDSGAPEQVWAGQSKTAEGTTYFDVWTSYSLLKKDSVAHKSNSITAEEGGTSAIDILSNKIRVEIKPPTTIDAVATLDLKVRQGGQRAVVFELARLLHLKEVLADGHPVEFIHNPAIEGTQLARHGNDLVAVVFPAPLQTGQRIELRFTYGGEVLSEAAAGLLYVGARGTWYPNRGIAMSNFDLEFHYPAGWTLVATGQRVDAPVAASPLAETTAPPEQVSHWVSDRPIPVAGFDLGKYQRVEARAGEVLVDAYATKTVERGFLGDNETVIPDVPTISRTAPALAASAAPSPVRNELMVANMSARAIEAYSRWFGPYPYHRLALTQFPGNMSQGWPGLVFLSSLSYLSNEEKSHLQLSPAEKTLIGVVIGHETAHQWWGDLVTWNDYRDQWIPEALANYSALMLVEADDSTKFHEVLDKYRNDLLFKNPAGVRLMEDGPVTLGNRLSCSQFPTGYEAISYGRGTWLLHMLRNMMLNAAPKSANTDSTSVRDEPFIRALRKVRERYEGKPITTRELLRVFEEDLPRPLWFEGRKSLDWFYDGWISGTAIPRIEVHGVKFVDSPEVTTITGTLLQKDAPDDLVTLVPLYGFHAGQMTLLGQVFADGPETPFQLTAPLGVRKILLDPKQTLLARQ